MFEMAGYWFLERSVDDWREMLPKAVELVALWSKEPLEVVQKRGETILNSLERIYVRRDPLKDAYQALHAATDPESFATALAELRRLQSLEADRMATHIKQHTPFDPARALAALAQADALIAQYEDPSRDDESS